MLVVQAARLAAIFEVGLKIAVIFERGLCSINIRLEFFPYLHLWKLY